MANQKNLKQEQIKYSSKNYFIDICDFEHNERGIYQHSSDDSDIMIVPYVGMKDLTSDDNFYLRIIRFENIKSLNDITNNKVVDGCFESAECVVKIGSVAMNKKNSTVFNRIQPEQNSDWELPRVIMTCRVDNNSMHCDDKVKEQLNIIIKSYNEFHYMGNNGHDEQYKIDDVSKLGLFLQLVNEAVLLAYPNQIIKKQQNIFNDVFNLEQTVFKNLKKKFGICYFCPRAGKTTFTLLLGEDFTKKYKTKIDVLLYYTGTASSSYYSSIQKYSDWDDVLFIDSSNITKENYEKTKEKIQNHINKGDNSRIMYSLPLTGDKKCFENRAKLLFEFLNVCKFNILIEEADFGACCPKQVSKINILKEHDNMNKLIMLTGSGYNKLGNIVPKSDCDIFTYDYIVDILGQYKN